MKAFSRPPRAATMRENSPSACCVVPLNIMCSRACETPVIPVMFVRRPDLVPDLDDRDRRAVIFLDNQAQTVVELIFVRRGAGGRRRQGQRRAQQGQAQQAIDHGRLLLSDGLGGGRLSAGRWHVPGRRCGAGQHSCPGAAPDARISHSCRPGAGPGSVNAESQPCSVDLKPALLARVTDWSAASAACSACARRSMPPRSKSSRRSCCAPMSA